MTVVAPAPTGPAIAAPLPVRQPSRWRPVLLGLLFLALLAGVLAVVLQSFSGAFSTYALAQAQLPASATAVALGSPVEYRNVTVGSVASQGRAVGGGMVALTLHLEPAQLAVIPAGVRATETPVSFFGDTYVVLVPPSGPPSGHLRAGDTIPALRVGQTASLQATLGDLDTLLRRLHPAELDAALTALAGALQGNGRTFGGNLVRANTYFSQMLPLWPTVLSDLRTLVPVANQFAASTPDLLKILANQTTTASTITSLAPEVDQAISGGEELAGRTADLLSAIQEPYAVLAADSGPFLNAISANPQEISQLLGGLDAWARAWGAAEASGPYLQITQDQVVVNAADLGLAVVGGPQAAAYLGAGLGPGTVNPPTYNSPGSLSATGSSPSPVLVSEPVMSAADQTAAVARIVHAVSGRAPRSPAVATLLLSPVLQNLVSGR